MSKKSLSDEDYLKQVGARVRRTTGGRAEIMPSRTAFRRDRIARAVIRGARNLIELVSTALQARLEEDGVFRAMELGEEPIVQQALSEDTAEAVATLEP